MSTFIDGIDVTAVLIKLDLRVITLELVVNAALAQLPPGAITDNHLNEIREKAKQLLHEKYPQIDIKD